jgi:hypothetical protein
MKERNKKKNKQNLLLSQSRDLTIAPPGMISSTLPVRELEVGWAPSLVSACFRACGSVVLNLISVKSQLVHTCRSF